MKDKYDEAVEYLTARPEEILETWTYPSSKQAGCLFGFATPDPFVRAFNKEQAGRLCGCLTEIKGRGQDAWTDELTAAIRGDERIPSHGAYITVEHLPIFAEWQRRIDKELNRL